MIQQLNVPILFTFFDIKALLTMMFIIKEAHETIIRLFAKPVVSKSMQSLSLRLHTRNQLFGIQSKIGSPLQILD